MLNKTYIRSAHFHTYYIGKDKVKTLVFIKATKVHYPKKKSND